MYTEGLRADLFSKIKRYHPAQNLDIVERAVDFALSAHGTQQRASGEAYIVHPLSVAIILAELELDLESIAAGILHDVVEDTRYTAGDIVALFGEEIALLVDGVTKLDHMEYTSKVEEQAENYRKMFLAMAKDIRVILIKIADRLHNMRTLAFLSAERQAKIAQETLDIYAPLAHRLGISRLRYELEDLSFKYLEPKAYRDLAERISLKQSERVHYVDRIVAFIREKIAETGVVKRAVVEGRPKHFFSIYKKMVSKDKTLDQIYDLFAVRVLVAETRECYEVLGLLHEIYKPVPGRFKDYIGIPKSNRYQSLHTTLIGFEGDPFEVQIRTFEMHKVAEYGIAAHWKYKEGKGGGVEPGGEDAKLAWLRQMLDWQRELADSSEYLDALKLDLNVYKNHVYCFTPKGEVVSLTNGATPIDFAYAIHSAVGNRMVGARVNGKIVTFDYVLATGDRVEIITSQNAKGPGKDWLKLVKTTQARSKINQWLKKENRADNVVRGRELLEAEAKQRSMTLTDLLADGREDFILGHFNCPDMDSLCAAVGYGGVREGKVVGRLFAEYQRMLPPATAEEIIRDLVQEGLGDTRAARSGVVVKGLGDAGVRFSKCCSPLPGDEIVGYIRRGREMSIHRTDCPNVINMGELDRKQRLIEVHWQTGDNPAVGVGYHADLRVLCDDREGLVFDISRILKEDRVHVSSITARSVRSDAVIALGVEISSRDQLDRLCASIRRMPGTHEVERVTS